MSAHRRIDSALFYLCAVAVLTLAALLVWHRGAEPPWEIGHHSFHMGEYPHNARNYLRFGYVNTKLGLVENMGASRPPDGFTYRVDHGPILSVLISLAYRAFGVHPWTARLMPALLCIGTSFLTALLACRLASDNRWVGLVAFSFSALSPMYLFYGRLPAPHHLATFFCVVLFYCYWRWFTIGCAGYLVGTFAALLLGACSDWTAYFCVPAVLAHYLLFRGGRRDWRFVAGLIAASILLAASYFWWTTWLKAGASTSGFDYFLNLFLFRTLGLVRESGAYVVTWWVWWRTHYRSAGAYLTPAVALAGVAWLIHFVWNTTWARITSAEALVFFLFVFGLSHNLLFQNLVVIHDIRMWYALVPFFSIAAALMYSRLPIGRSPQRRLLGIGVCLVVGTLFVQQSLGSFVALQHRSGPLYQRNYYLGAALNSLVSPTGAYLTTTGLEDRRTSAIIDRPGSTISSLEDLTPALESGGRFEAIVSDDSETIDPRIVNHLLASYPRATVAGYSIFDLTRPGSNVLVDDPDIEHSLHITFGDQIEYLGYDLEEVVYRKDEDITWWDRYLAKYAQLLPENRTTFKVVNYWRRLSDDDADYYLVTQFDTQIHDPYRLEQQYAGLDDLYPTSMWPVGQVVREEFEVYVPHEYPSQHYAMWVGIREGEEAMTPAGEDLAADDSNRVRVGQVDVRSNNTPEPLGEVPQPEEIVDVERGAISLLGYDTHMSSDGINLTTYWDKSVHSDEDYAFLLSLRNEYHHISVPVEVASPQLWMPGKHYEGRTHFSPYTPKGIFDLYLEVKDEWGGRLELQLGTISWCQPSSRFLAARTGAPDGSLAEELGLLSPQRELLIHYELAQPQAVEIIIGWTGKSQFDQTRIKAFAHNDEWRLGKDRYRKTLVVKGNDPATSRVRIPALLARVGDNYLKLTVPKRTLVGWRGILATIIPDLEPLLWDQAWPHGGPYAGWIEPDFVQVRMARPPYDFDDLAGLKTKAIEDLAEAWQMVNSHYAGCPMPENVKEYVAAAETSLRQVELDQLSPQELVELYNSGIAEMRDLIGPAMWATLPDNLDQVLVDETGSARIRVLGYSLDLPGNEEEATGLNLYFEALDDLPTDYTIFLHGHVKGEDRSLLPEDRQQSGFANWDHNPQLPTSEWVPGNIYVDSYQIQANPGEYRLSFGFFSRQGDGDVRLYPQGSEEPGIDLGWHEIRQRYLLPELAGSRAWCIMGLCTK